MILSFAIARNLNLRFFFCHQTHIQKKFKTPYLIGYYIPIMKTNIPQPADTKKLIKSIACFHKKGGNV